MWINTLSRNQANQRGFTLIELMLVLAIASILVVVTVPKYRAMTDYYRLQSSVQTTTSFIRYAKQRALDEHIDNHVLITNSSASPANTVQVLNPSFLAVQSKSLATGVTLLSVSGPNPLGNSIISFNSRGYLDPDVTDPPSDTASFTLKSSSNRTVKVNVDLLGNVTTVWN